MGGALLLIHPGSLTDLQPARPLPRVGGAKTASLPRLGLGAACPQGSLSVWSFTIHGLGKLLMIRWEAFQGDREETHTSIRGLGCATSFPPRSAGWGAGNRTPPFHWSVAMMCAYILSISSNEGKCRSVSNMSKSHVRLFKGREYLLYLFSNFKLRVLQHSISVCRTSIDVLWTEKYNKNKTILRIPYNYLVNDSFSSCLCEIIHCVRLIWADLTEFNFKPFCKEHS